MTAPPPEEPEGPRDPRDRDDLDFDAEFERLIADWEPDTSVEPVETTSAESEPTPVEPVETDDNLRNLFRGAWPDEPDSSSDEPVETEHFVPPPAPPIPRPEPRRLIAWAGLACAPIVGLVLLVVGALPSWMSFLLFCWFVGGFGYLIATMNDGGRDGWDDGARV